MSCALHGNTQKLHVCVHTTSERQSKQRYAPRCNPFEPFLLAHVRTIVRSTAWKGCGRFRVTRILDTSRLFIIVADPRCCARCSSHPYHFCTLKGYLLHTTVTGNVREERHSNRVSRISFTCMLSAAMSRLETQDIKYWCFESIGYRVLRSNSLNVLVYNENVS